MFENLLKTKCSNCTYVLIFVRKIHTLDSHSFIGIKCFPAEASFLEFKRRHKDCILESFLCLEHANIRKESEW